MNGVGRTMTLGNNSAARIWQRFYLSFWWQADVQEEVASVFCFNGNTGRNDGKPTSPHPAHLLPVSQEWRCGAVKCENRKEG